MNFPIWKNIGFQQQDGQDSQNLTKDTFCRLPITSAQSVNGTERYPAAGIISIYDTYDCTHGYAEIKEASRASTKDVILKPFISDHDFRSAKIRADDIGYN